MHPAESRVRKLAASSPANYFAFDLLYAKGKLLTGVAIGTRRERLETFFAGAGASEWIRLSPGERKVARKVVLVIA